MNDKRTNQRELATFAGGCFWCMVSPFEDLPGVIRVTTGYTGGNTLNPTYREVCSGSTGHFEAVQIEFDPSKTSYEELLTAFWHSIDPTDPGGQFFDRGQQYQTAIFYHSDDQRLNAEVSMEKINHSGYFSKPIATHILPACTFYPAEEYHQEYHKKNPEHYQSYKAGSGRQAFIEQTWKHTEI